MDNKTILMVVVAIVLGMLVANMFKDVCGCKVVEGQAATLEDGCIITESGWVTDLTKGQWRYINTRDQQDTYECLGRVGSPTWHPGTPAYAARPMLTNMTPQTRDARGNQWCSRNCPDDDPLQGAVCNTCCSEPTEPTEAGYSGLALVGGWQYVSGNQYNCIARPTVYFTKAAMPDGVDVGSEAAAQVAGNSWCDYCGPGDIHGPASESKCAACCQPSR